MYSSLYPDLKPNGVWSAPTNRKTLMYHDPDVDEIAFHKRKYEELLNTKLKVKTGLQEALARCPFHRQAKKPAVVLDLISGLWRCHAGCGGGTFPQFRRRVITKFVAPPITKKKRFFKRPKFHDFYFPTDELTDDSEGESRFDRDTY